MSLEAARKGMRDAHPVVVTEAPAGCGKTHEAAALAGDLAQGLSEDREVLLLAHTNAAVEEFRARTSERGVRVRALTLDAFALELIVPYATQLGLPSPLRPGHDGVEFSDLATKLGELFTRAPSIAASVALHYPVIVLDEHQDSRVEQHRIVDLLRAAAPVLVRIFGDPMQAIYGFDGELVGWSQLDADKTYSLSEPRRWEEEPELGEWIMTARDALLNEPSILVDRLPASVHISTVDGLTDLGRYWRHASPQMLRALRTQLTTLEGTVAVLVPLNQNALGTRIGLGPLIAVYEGAEPKLAYDALDAATEVVGQPRELALILIGLLQKASTGLDKRKRDAIDRSLGEERVDIGRRRTVRSVVERLSPLYECPDVPTFCAVAGRLLSDPPSWLKIHLPEALRCLGQVDVQEGEDPLAQLAGVARYRKLAKRLPRRCVTTVHKSKGREFDHVVIPCAGASAFPDDEDGRRRLYVAMTRARRSLHVLLPSSGSTPLLGRS